MKIIDLGLVVFCILVCAVCASAQSNQSVYTDLKLRCRTIKSDSSGTGSYAGLCPGFGGYKLLVEEGDLRQNIQVFSPGGKKHSLDLWTVVGSSFSSLGPKAEWRVRKQGSRLVPVALIVRYNLSSPDDSTKITSYLAVAKITAGKICVTDKIAPGADANVAARTAADNSADKPCLENSN